MNEIDFNDTNNLEAFFLTHPVYLKITCFSIDLQRLGMKINECFVLDAVEAVNRNLRKETNKLDKEEIPVIKMTKEKEITDKAGRQICNSNCLVLL